MNSLLGMSVVGLVEDQDSTERSGFARGGRKRSRFNPATALFATAMMVTGACGLVAEYCLSTVSTYILGSSITQWSVTIGLMMLMMGVSGYIQRFTGDTRLVERFIYVELFLCWLTGFAPIANFAMFGFMEDHFLLIYYASAIFVGLAIGLEIPLMLRINEKYSATLKSNVANIFSPDYIGSFIGAVAWLYLLKHFPLTEIGFLMAALNFLVACAVLRFFWKRKLVVSKIATMTAILLTGVALVFGYAQNRDWSISLQQKLYEDPIKFTKITRYQQLVMTENTKLGEFRFYINGNLQFSSLDEAIYHENLVHPVMTLVPDHQRVLILGGGDGLALREILKYRDVREVVLVDLDPEMTTFCAANPIMLQMNDSSLVNSKVQVIRSGAVGDAGTKRAIYQEMDQPDKRGLPVYEQTATVSVINIDADRFVEQIQGKYNVIIVDFPDPESVELAKLYSREFYLKLSRVLSENGMFVVQSTSPYHAKESFLCIGRTIVSAGFEALPYHDNVPSFGDWGYWLCWKSQISEDKVRERIAAIDSFAVPTRYLTPEVFRRAMVFGKGWLKSKHSEVNSLMRPVLLEYYVGESWLVD